MTLADLIQAHVAKLAEIQQSGIDFSKRVAEHHVKVVERNIRGELHVGDKLFPEEKEPEKVA